MKITATFTIESEILKEFRDFSKKQAINMSQFVENKMKEKLEENINAK